MDVDEGQRVHVWVQEESPFGPGGRSKRGEAWTVDGSTDEDFRQGGTRVGYVDRTDEPTADGAFASVTLVIHLHGTQGQDGTLIAKGVLPYEGEDVGSGRLAITGGTGAHAVKRGTIDVRSWNPKKYREMP